MMHQISTDFIEMYLCSITTFNFRFAHYATKIEENLNEIVTLLNEPFENIEDTLLQREKRIATEFSKRFTRDHLYPIELLVNKLESELLIFISCKTCKIAQSMILRPLVLSVLKKLSYSVRIYWQFLRKRKTKITIKLKEILNFISHFFSIIKLVVDHRILNNNDIEDTCATISSWLKDQQKNSCNRLVKDEERIIKNKFKKGGINPKRKLNFKVPLWKVSKSKRLCDISKETLSNTHSCSSFKNKCSEVEHISIDETCSKLNNTKPDAQIENINKLNCLSMHNTVSNVLARLSDAILTTLFEEVCLDISRCIQEIALEMFNVEFTNSN